MSFAAASSSRSLRSLGFTLVELMVCVAIAGLGGSLALMNLSEQVAAARHKADGLAMLERIRQEHRTSKELMKGMLLSPTPDHELLFQEAVDCEPVPGGTELRVPFKATTQLVLTGASAYCWDARGQPQVQPDPDLPPPPPPAKPKKKGGHFDPSSEVVELAALPGIGIFTEGASEEPGKLTSIVMSQTGVSPGLVEGNVTAVDAKVKLKKIKEDKGNGKKPPGKSKRK
ncbi:MAG TPA: prepilin-type N-terminal cleavage/methylation domain-containing protein [Myxococcota bacterium]